MSCHNPRQMYCLHYLACRALVITAHSVMIAGLRSIKRMRFFHGCEIMFLHLESIGRSHIRGIHTWPEWGCMQLCRNACSSMGMHAALGECTQRYPAARCPVIRSVWAECLSLAALQLFHGALSQCFQQ